MTYAHLLVDRDGDITTITLNRPEKRNALVARRDGRAHRRRSARSARPMPLGVILAANGPVFSAGHNFGDMAGASRSTTRATCSRCAPR